MIYLPTYTVGKIRVKCNQTGKLFNVKATTLCGEDGDPLQKKYLVEGAQLVMHDFKQEALFSYISTDNLSPWLSNNK